VTAVALRGKLLFVRAGAYAGAVAVAEGDEAAGLVVGVPGAAGAEDLLVFMMLAEGSAMTL
jgi:hypothetical protein